MMNAQTVPDGALHCTFCRKERHQVANMVAGPGVYICDACVALCSRMMTGKATAAFAGWASLSDEELLATLPAAAAAVSDASEKVREHVDMLRLRGVSWERIASALGVTRQAAWERFSSGS
jgi:DNA-directed RNA polymerase specialized sigma24 family protein